MSKKVFLVIGGGGFLGRVIIDQLLARGEKGVKVFDIRKTFEDPRLSEFIVGDITKIEDLKKACQGVTTVIHTASPAVGVSGNYTYEFIHKVNVIGTANVIEACVATGVRQLIYTSSSSVVFEGKDLHLVDESTPYASKHLDSYGETKAEAEKLVLKANGRGNLLTVALRPSGIFGPRDVQAWPGFIETGKRGKSTMQIGNGKNQFDWTYVDNIAHAHLLAADKLTETSKLPGQAYFITNDEPTPFWDMANYVYREMGYPTTKYALPYYFIYSIAVVLSFASWALSLFSIKFNPTFTPFRIANAGANRTFSVEKAKRDFGYSPIVSLEEGKRRTLQYFRQMRQEGKI